MRTSPPRSPNLSKIHRSFHETARSYEPAEFQHQPQHNQHYSTCPRPYHSTRSRLHRLYLCVVAASEYERGFGREKTCAFSRKDEYNSEYHDAFSIVHGQERTNGSKHLCGQGIAKLEPSLRLINKICVYLYRCYRTLSKVCLFRSP